MEKNLKFLGVGAAVRWFGTSMVYPFVGLYLRNALGAGYTEIGLVLLVIGAAPLAVAPFGGVIVDRVGRRKILLISLGLETAGVFVIALSMRSGVFPGVVLGGVLAGVAGNIESPASSAYVADYASGSERTTAFSWIRIGFNVGFTIGVASGGFLVGYLGFPGTGFLSAALIGAATVLLSLLLSPSPYDLSRTKPSPSLERESSGPGTIRQSFGILARDRNLLVLSLAFALASMTYSQWNTTFPLFAGKVAMPYWVIGAALAINGVIVTVGQAPVTAIMIGRKHTPSAIYSLLLLIAGCLVLGVLSSIASTVVVGVFTYVILITLGENLGALPFMTLPSNLAPVGEIGAYNGAFGMISGLGGAIAPSLGGFALSSTGNSIAIWAALAIPAVPSILLFRHLGQKVAKDTNRV